MYLELHGVSYQYRSDSRVLPALNDVSLHVPNQEFLAVVGPAGCGKSTLLDLIGGFLSPSAGHIFVGGKLCSGPGPDRMMIFQKSALFPFYTVARNIEYGLKLRGMGSTERALLTNQVLTSIGLLDFGSAYPKELSEGMRKLVEVARALVLAAPILLFDESLANLDALSRYRMQHLIERLWLDHPRTTLWVTHDLEEAALLADRVVVLSPRPGRIMAVKDVRLPRPRTEEIRMSSDLQRIRKELLDLLGADKTSSEVRLGSKR